MQKTMQSPSPHTRHWRVALCSVWLLVLTACTLARASSSAPAVRARLAEQMATAQSAHTAAAALWERLIDGETVFCTETFPTPPALKLSARERDAHPLAAPVADALEEARRSLQVAAELWQGACTSPAPTVPLETARAALQALHAAEDALAQASAWLAAW